MGKQLIIDTTAQYLVVGLTDDDKIISKTQYVAWQRQSEFAIQEVKKTLDSVGIKANEIDRVVVTNGPGSYTGIRIALTIAKVLSLALKKPVCVLSSLQAIAGVRGLKIAILDARNKRAYVGVYKDGKAITKDQVVNIEELDALRKKYPDYELVGDTQVLGLEAKPIDFVENMFDLSKIIGNCADVDALVPVYLREAI